VEVVTAYATRLREPSGAERRAVAAADAVTFASGSAARAWADAFGVATPPIVAVIGPSTAGVATGAGLQVTHVASDHSIAGLAAAVAAALGGSP
jgi:uroporphyrinogen-III synthase